LIDSIRPYIALLWASLSTREKKQFLRHLKPFWEIHRHRMAPAAAQKLAALVDCGRLEIIAGRLESLTASMSESSETSASRSFQAQIARRGANRETYHVSLALNCTGPNLNFQGNLGPDALLKSAILAGLVQPCPLGLGIISKNFKAVASHRQNANSGIWAVGSLLKSQIWESTAVPEIRKQVETLAGILVAQLACDLSIEQPCNAASMPEYVQTNN